MNGLSPYWLGDPEVRLATSKNEAQRDSVFLPNNPLRSRSLVAPLMWLRPLQGTTQQNPLVPPLPAGTPDEKPFESSEEDLRALRPSHHENSKEKSWLLRGRTLERWAFQQLSWSSSPLRRIGSSESTSPRLASPGTFRPQGFAPSRRFPPRSNARPCFMPVTSLGFCSPGVFPHNQVRSASAEGLPSWRSSTAATTRIAALQGVWHGWASRLTAQTIGRLQGVAPVVNPYRGRIVTS